MMIRYLCTWCVLPIEYTVAHVHGKCIVFFLYTPIFRWFWFDIRNYDVYAQV